MIRAVVTDIEGTTSSLSFVHRVLFPYARTRLAEFVAAHRDDPPVHAALDEARKLLGGQPDDAQIAQAMLQWIDQDRKLAPLKAIQGMIWEEGYRRGDFTGHVYEDAARHLRRWKAQGLDLYIFSSGSVQAQQLLFRHTPYGDLTPLFSGYFDTRTGPKREAAAYRAISAAIGHPAGETLFLSDVPEELDAAREAGMATRWMVRETQPAPASAHPQVTDFDAIDL